MKFASSTKPSGRSTAPPIACSGARGRRVAVEKLKLVHEKISLGVLIHQHVRAAVEQAVQEDLAVVLGVEL